MKAAAIIVAAGAGRRFGTRTPKQFLRLRGIPLFLWSVRAFRNVRDVRQIVLVVPEKRIKTLSRYCRSHGVTLAAGGKERADSVRSGLACVRDDIDYVAIHDGARPLVTPALIRRSLAAAKKYKAVIPALPAVDTVKLCGASLRITKTVPRQQVWCAQTPQIFERSLLAKAYAAAGSAPVTDDAQLLERAGRRVFVVRGEPENIKITERRDLKLAAFLIKR